MSSKKSLTKPLLRRTLSRVVGDQFRGAALRGLAESFSGESAADNSRRLCSSACQTVGQREMCPAPGKHRGLQASGCQTLPIRSVTGQLADHSSFGILAVQGRYKEYLCRSVLKRLLRYMQERPLPDKFLCLQ